MASLIITIISIALLSVVVLAGLNYINVDSVRQIETRGDVRTGFIQLSAAFYNYRQLNRAVLPELNWEATLTPEYGFMPNDITNGTWEYHSVIEGQNFCLTGSFSEIQFNALQSLKKRMSAQAYFISQNCSVTENFSEGTQPATPTVFPATISATYWLTR